jgi:hypothetical protein
MSITTQARHVPRWMSRLSTTPHGPWALSTRTGDEFRWDEPDKLTATAAWDAY